MIVSFIRTQKHLFMFILCKQMLKTKIQQRAVSIAFRFIKRVICYFKQAI